MGENTTTNNHWLTLPEAAAHIKVKVDTIRDHIYGGHLQAYKIGSARSARMRIKESDLEALLIPYTPKNARPNEGGVSPPTPAPQPGSGGTTSPSKTRTAFVAERIAELGGGGDHHAA